MRRIYVLLSILALLAFGLSACAPTPTQPATDEEPAASLPTEAPAPVKTDLPPTLAPLDLTGPPAGWPMVWVDGSILVHVPGGEFLMGDGGADNPIHTVSLSSFWIYRTKVTNGMYSTCIAAGVCSPPQDVEPAEALSDPVKRDQPVVGVNWNQAQAYCSFVLGHLPTEAQWEKTARGPEGNIYPWGDSAPNCDLLNFNNCVGDTSKVFDYPVGKSFYEALDLAGNTFEWVADWYNPQYYGDSPEINPLGPELGEVRSVRSSSYLSSGDIVSPARRFFLKPEETRPDLGFRCVVEAPQKFEPYCEQVRVPGWPGDQPPGGDQPGTNACPQPGFAQVGNGCDAGFGYAIGQVSGGQIASVVGAGCTQTGLDTVYCSGTPETTVGFNVCVEGCQLPDGTADSRQECPPGSFFDVTTEQCAGEGQTGQCFNGFTYLPEEQCCQAEPRTDYPGCAPDEILDPFKGCVPGTPAHTPPGCFYFTMSLGKCGGGGSDLPKDPCNQYNQRECTYTHGNQCRWNTDQNICVSY